MFVYDAANNPKWYVGPSTQLAGSSSGTLIFTGPLYETKGPYFGAATYSEASVQVTQVGTITFAGSGISTASLGYTVNGVTVTKNIKRQTWAQERVGGGYYGATIGTYSGCSAEQNGYFESPASFTVNQNLADAITIVEQGANYTCTYNGIYTQAGRMGSIAGQGTCVPQTGSQTFFATEVQGGVQGLTMRYQVTYAGSCIATGRMGGMRKGN